MSVSRSAQVSHRTLDRLPRACYTEVTLSRNNYVSTPAMLLVAGVSRSGGALMDAFDAAAQSEQRSRDAALASVVAEAMAQEVHAEARAAQGLAGICEDCGGRIDAKRMAAYPWATTCRTCARGEDE
jgi:RNA polymerase-binding transcription factor DksA